MNEIQKQYNSLLDSGELKTMFPNFFLAWEKDKKSFTKYFKENEDILKLDSIDLDDDYI